MKLCWSDLVQLFLNAMLDILCISQFSTLMCWYTDGKACPAGPALEQWRVCNDHPCVVFHWEASAWGPCIEDTSMALNGTSLQNGTITCAVGVQIRKVICVKMNAGPVVNKRWSLCKLFDIWTFLNFMYSDSVFFFVMSLFLYRIIYPVIWKSKYSDVKMQKKVRKEKKEIRKGADTFSHHCTSNRRFLPFFKKKFV